MKRRVAGSFAVAAIALLAGCQHDGFLVGGAGVEKRLGMIAPVPIKPAKTFSGHRHLGLEILSAGYERTPYFVSSPARTNLVLEPCQAVYLAGDRDGTTPMQVNNFLLVEVAQGTDKHAVTLGNVETVRRNGRELPHIGPDSPVIPAGMPRLDKVIKPGIPAEITVTPLANQDVGGVGAIYLIVERANSKDPTGCGNGDVGFDADNTRKKPKPADDGAMVFRTPEERIKSFKTMPAEMIPGARPPLSNGDTPPPPMPATPVEAVVLPGSQGIPAKGTPGSKDAALEERMRSFRSTPQPDPGTLAARNRANKQRQAEDSPPLSNPPPNPAQKPASPKQVPAKSVPMATKPEPKPPEPKPPEPKHSAPDIKVAPKYVLKKPDVPGTPKVQAAPRMPVQQEAAPPLPKASGNQSLRTEEDLKKSGQPALGARVAAGKIITRKDKDGKITKTFVPADGGPEQKLEE